MGKGQSYKCFKTFVYYGSEWISNETFKMSVYHHLVSEFSVGGREATMGQGYEVASFKWKVIFSSSLCWVRGMHLSRECYHSVKLDVIRIHSGLCIWCVCGRPCMSSAMCKCYASLSNEHLNSNRTFNSTQKRWFESFENWILYLSRAVAREEWCLVISIDMEGVLWFECRLFVGKSNQLTFRERRPHIVQDSFTFVFMAWLTFGQTIKLENWKIEREGEKEKEGEREREKENNGGGLYRYQTEISSSARFHTFPPWDLQQIAFRFIVFHLRLEFN